MRIVDIPGTCVIAVIACPPLFADLYAVSVICQVLCHPVVEHHDFDAVRQGFIRDYLVGQCCPELGVTTVIFSLIRIYRISDIHRVYRQALFWGHIVALRQLTDARGLCDGVQDGLVRGSI